MVDFGLKVSKTGFDVQDVTDDRSLIFSSSFKTHKISSTGTVNIVVPASDTSVNSTTVSHGLSYVPTGEVYVDSSTLSYDLKLPYSTVPGEASGDPGFDWKIDSNSLTIYVQHQTSHGSSITYTFRYIIFIDKLK